jgi:predicted dithiol-disulfide oxidoreductase (DUF899 family)
MTHLPPPVSHDAWQAAIEALRLKEKQATHARDALAAERRRLPLLRVQKNYVFSGPDGESGLVDLFGDRQQLIVYHFMFDPSWTEGCVGCSMFTDNLGDLTHLLVRDTAMVLVSRAPLATIAPYKARMGWTVPWLSSFGSDFNADFGVTVDGEETFGLSALVRDGDTVYRSYFTDGRGVETLGPVWALLDVTLFGRQEEWEDSPPGWPKDAPGWRRHDEYGDQTGGSPA